MQLRAGLLRMRRSNSARRVALGGVFCALSLVMMLLGSVLPAATFVAPALAGLFLVPVAIEYGMRAGFASYASVAILSLFLVPDREMSLFFIFLLGHYPLLKAYLERIRNRAARAAAKLAVFNASVAAVYLLLLKLFPLEAASEELLRTAPMFPAVLLAAGNLTFCVYDMAVKRLVTYYCIALRPRLFPH